jgi:hypothetical protein
VEDLRIYGINISAITGVAISDINPYLSTLVLLTTLVYTVLQILEKFKKK